LKGENLLDPHRKLTFAIVLIAVTVVLLASISQTSAFIIDTVISSDSSGVAKSNFNTNQDIYATVTGHNTGNKNADIYIVTSIPASNDLLAPISVKGPITVTYNPTTLTQVAWTNPTTPGTYYIVIDEDTNGHYNTGSSTDSISAAFTVSTLMVTPEYTWGGLAALLTCFAAFAIFAKRSNLNPLKKIVD
jgi:hypothetical protein